MRCVALVAMLVAASLALDCGAVEPADTRDYWVCEGGWFAKSKDGSWYELNELTYRKLGKPSRFREVKRTKEYVELYDEGRKVGVRLFESVSESRDFADKDAPWQELYKGRWKTPVTEE